MKKLSLKIIVLSFVIGLLIFGLNTSVLAQKAKPETGKPAPKSKVVEQPKEKPAAKPEEKKAEPKVKMVPTKTAPNTAVKKATKHVRRHHRRIRRAKSTGTCEIGTLSGKCSGHYRCGSEIEPNESRILATPIAASNIYGCMMNYQDIDWFEIIAPIGDYPTFVLSHENNVDFDMEVYVEGKLAASATGTEPIDTITTKTSGKVYVRIYPAKGTGYYHLELVPGNTTFVP